MAIEVGTKLEGKVTGITHFGAFVDLIAKGDIRAVDDGLHRLGLVGGTGDVRIQSAWFVRVSWRDRWR